jgi:hypothetical protein
VTVAVAVCVPEVPVIVRLYCPRLAELLAVSVRTLYPVVGFGLHEAVTPPGRPDVMAMVTLPENPYSEFT